MIRVVAGARFQGSFGWAQHVAVPTDPNADVQVGSWLMWLPNQGIAWSYFLLSVVSLQERPGLIVHRQYPQAEYALMVQALAPDPEPAVDDAETWLPMLPANVDVQFHGLPRDRAAQVGEACAWWCVRGRLPAETQVYVQQPGREPAMMHIAQAVDRWKQGVAQLVQQGRRGRIPGRDS